MPTYSPDVYESIGDGYHEDPEQYRPGGMAPINLNTQLNDRYVIITKLGSAVKISTANSSGDLREVRVMEHLKNTAGGQKGQVTTCLDHFYHVSVNGVHLCVVLEPAEMSLGTFCLDSEGYETAVPLLLLRSMIFQVLKAVEALHDEGLVHGDLHTGNILLPYSAANSIQGLDTVQILQKLGMPDFKPLIRHDGRLTAPAGPASVIGLKPLRQVATEDKVLPRVKLSDFGETFNPATEVRTWSCAPMGNKPPEAIFRTDAQMDFASDIWSLGCLIFSLLGTGPLFDDVNGHPSNIAYQQIDAMGIEGFPLDWWDGWTQRGLYFNELAEPINRSTPPATLENALQCAWDTRKAADEEVMPDDEAAAFLDLLKTMMPLNKRDRPTIKQVLQHEWVLHYCHGNMQRETMEDHLLGLLDLAELEAARTMINVDQMIVPPGTVLPGPPPDW